MHIIAQVSGTVMKLERVDLDGDGDLDLLAAVRVGYYDDKVIWIENLGSGAYSGERPILETVDVIQTVTASDLDGDGDEDVIYSVLKTPDGDIVAWRKNLGGGSFGEEQLIVAQDGGDWWEVLAADLDGDGDADVIAGSAYDHGVLWFENLGGSLASGRTITDSFSDSHPLQFADLDGDGDLDFIPGYTRDGRVPWFENAGGGSFAARTGDRHPSACRMAASIRSTSMGDGDEDIIVLSSFQNPIGWLENQGGGRFADWRTIVGRDDGVRRLGAWDMDGDGDLDLVGYSNYNRLAWYRNQGWRHLLERARHHHPGLQRKRFPSVRRGRGRRYRPARGCRLGR